MPESLVKIQDWHLWLHQVRRAGASPSRRAVHLCTLSHPCCHFGGFFRPFLSTVARRNRV